MSSVNTVTLIGHLGADPEMKYTSSGQAVGELRIATSEAWKDKSGQKQERTEWHRVTVWGKTAETCVKYLAKGRLVYVRGRIQTDKYEKNGETRYITKVVADDVRFLGKGESRGGADRGATTPPDAPSDAPTMNDDIAVLTMTMETDLPTSTIGGWPALTADRQQRVWGVASRGGRWTCDCCGAHTATRDAADLRRFAEDHKEHGR